MVDTNKLTKLYYSIGEVAELFDVSSSLIRYWEQEFPSLKPHKNSKGDRRFTKQNISELNVIYDLVKVRGFTLDGAKKELVILKEGHDKKKQILKKLKKLKSNLIEIREMI